MMKISKKVTLGIIGAVALVLIAVIAVWGRNYYQDRYVSSDYYTMVPLDYDITPEPLYSMTSEEVGIGKSYDLIAYSADGTEKDVSFTVHGTAESLPQPGIYLLVKASNQIVTGWSTTTKDQIPADALAKIEGK
jgi:uncharacterized protein (TIGR01655 family)